MGGVGMTTSGDALSAIMRFVGQLNWRWKVARRIEVSVEGSPTASIHDHHHDQPYHVPLALVYLTAVELADRAVQEQRIRQQLLVHRPQWAFEADAHYGERR